MNIKTPSILFKINKLTKNHTYTKKFFLSSPLRTTFKLTITGSPCTVNLGMAEQGDTIKNTIPYTLPWNAAKPYSTFNRKLIALQKKFNDDLWSHINPYTRFAYEDDPAIVLVEIANENVNMIGKPVTSDALGDNCYQGGVFDTFTDPAKFGLFCHAVLMFRRGDGKSSEEVTKIRGVFLQSTKTEYSDLKLGKNISQNIN